MLETARKRGIAVGYIEKLLAAFPDQPDPIKAETREIKRGNALLVEPLSPREIDVLRLLNTSLTSTEIADELVIAVSTVRTHIKNIYSKLGVNRRLAAVEVAKELGLI